MIHLSCHMDHPSFRRKPSSQRDPLHCRPSWCCSFAIPPTSPENLHSSHPPEAPHGSSRTSPKQGNSLPNSPLSSVSGLSYRRRILSPGSVSPIDPMAESCPINPPSVTAPSRSESLRVPSRAVPEDFSSPTPLTISNGGNCIGGMIFDLRLKLKGKNGHSLILELNSEAICANSAVFSNMISETRNGSGGQASKMCRIEVSDVENLGIFRQTIELMFEADIIKKLLHIGVYQSICVLEVSAGIMFTKGIMSCLKYLEAVPWNEQEEEKLRNLFSRLDLDDSRCGRDISSRLHYQGSPDVQQNLGRELVWSIIDSGSTNTDARNEVKSFMKGLLCETLASKKDELYSICEHCLYSLCSLLKEASSNISVRYEGGIPLMEHIFKQVDNINWVVEILIDKQMAEEFVDMWGNELELVRLHGDCSPMVRFDISRVSAMVFVAIGSRKVQCRCEARTRVMQSWLGPMLRDFGWLRRCRKGLDMKMLEEGMGEVILTLSLDHQHSLFMEWFRYFSKHGTECPNLSGAFQIWWHRTSPKALDIYSI